MTSPGADLTPTAGDGSSAVVLRHKDATRQSVLYGVFALLLPAIVAGVIWLEFPGRYWSLIFLPIALFLGYSAARLATLQVRLDAQGIWEPNPFRLTYVTPWSDVKRVDKALKPGRVQFLTVRITHRDGDTHDVVALNMQARAAYAEPTVEGWVQSIRDAKKRWA
ncbi:hypothetical protein [Demequina activiva]|uniref:PH domain-containing protein n=1 Tax=Demequina activiva TaxID=1582364 RepID=A0A919Q056_9MICO|nr:hypothetical protein [Demequina activiva]GIG53569.1 hypothetical protein Dac01nite_03210 [Demequina activiva]